MAERYYKQSYNGYSTGGITLELHMYTIGTSIANNTTTERADLYVVVSNASAGWWNLYGTEAFVGINGNNKTASVPFDARSTGTKMLISSWDTVITHNSSGTASIGISAHHYTGIGLGNAVIQDTYVCDTIPRYATSTQSLASKTETTITMNWSSDNVVDYIWYSKDNGSNWTGIDVADGKSGSYTISSLSANTEYKIKTRVRRKDSQLTTDSSMLSVTTYDYPHITNTPNFTIGNAVWLDLYNPLGRNCTCIMYGDDGSTVFSGSNWTGTRIGDFATSSIIENLYKSIPNKKTGTYSIKIRYNGVDRDKTNAGTYTIRGTETPTFTNFTFKDTSSIVVGLTGNNQIIVNGLSNVQVAISTANKAVGKNSASIVKYRFTIGNTIKELNYSSSSEVSTTFDKVTTDTITVSAIDSRGLETTISKVATFKNYTKPVVKTLEIARENGVGTKVLFKLGGTIWTGNFGAVQNDFQDFSYRWRVKGGTYSSFIRIRAQMTYGDGKFSSMSGAFLPTTSDGTTAVNFEVGKEYEIYFRVQDKAHNVPIETDTTILTLNSGIPCTAKRKNSNGMYSIGINQLPDSSVSLAINGSEKISGNLNVTGNSTVGGTLNVTGLSTLPTIAGGTNVKGNITIDNNIYSKGNLDFSNNNSARIKFKESGWGDKFEIAPSFDGTGDNNYLGVYSATGGQGTDPDTALKVKINASGNIYVHGGSEKIKGEVVLYDNASGSTGTITMNAEANKYEYIIIYAKYNNVYGISTKISTEYPKVNITACMNNQTANTTYLAATNYTLSGKTLTPEYYGERAIVQATYNSNNLIYITKIVGIGGK